MPNTPNTPQFVMADRVTGGVLADKISRWRDLGVSWPAIAALLSDEHQITINVETLRRWGKVICPDVEAGEAA